jgi:hypothetical protein
MEQEQTLNAITGRRWPRRMRRVQAAEYLLEEHGIHQSAATLAKKYTIGGGPAVVHFGGIPYYSREALDAWVSERSGKGRLGREMEAAHG